MNREDVMEAKIASTRSATHPWISAATAPPPARERILLLHPPYGEQQLCSALLRQQDARLRRGSIAGLEVTRSDIDLEALRGIVNDIIRTIPAARP